MSRDDFARPADATQKIRLGSDQTQKLRLHRDDTQVLEPVPQRPEPASQRPEPAPRRSAPAPRRSGPRMRTVTVAAFVLAAAAGVAVGALGAGHVPASGGGSGGGAVTRPATDGDPHATVLKPVRVSSVDPSGGSGFLRRNGGWFTQHYTSPDFGNLKPGVGLLLDLGQPRRLDRVVLDIATPGIQLQLRGGDRPGALHPLGPPTQAGRHEVMHVQGKARYVLVWVTRLVGSGGGYQAGLSRVVVQGR